MLKKKTKARRFVRAVQSFSHAHGKKKKSREKKKSPLNRLLSDTHGFIYSVLHCIYTSLYKKGPFIEGSYCKSSTWKPMTASGPFVLEFFLMYSQREKEKAWDRHGWLFLQTQRNRSAPTHAHALRSRCDNKKKNWANKHRAKEIEEKEGRKGRREKERKRRQLWLSVFPEGATPHWRRWRGLAQAASTHRYSIIEFTWQVRRKKKKKCTR